MPERKRTEAHSFAEPWKQTTNLFHFHVCIILLQSNICRRRFVEEQQHQSSRVLALHSGFCTSIGVNSSSALCTCLSVMTQPWQYFIPCYENSGQSVKLQQKNNPMQNLKETNVQDVWVPPLTGQKQPLVEEKKIVFCSLVTPHRRLHI